VEDLVARSLLLLHPTPGGPARYRMLHTVRAAVLDQPAAGATGAGATVAGAGPEVEARRARHARHFLEVAAGADDALRGPAEPDATRRLQQVLAELRTAHSWARTHDPSLAAELTAHLQAFAVATQADEVLQWGARLAPVLADDEDRAVAEVAAAARLSVAGELAVATGRALTALEAARRPATRWAALEVLADAALYDGRLEECGRLGTRLRAEAGEAGDRLYVALGGTSCALALAYAEDRTAARAELAATTALLDRLGPLSPSSSGWLAYAAAEVEAEPDPAAAAEHLHRAVTLADATGNRYLGGVARVARTSLQARHGDPADAAAPFADVVRWWLDQGNRTHLLTALRNLVELQVRLGRDGAAAELWGAVVPATLSPSYGAERRRLDRAAEVLAGRLGEE
ncbi:MAG: hypothetical protein H5T83_01900, partial [Actinotalea sp.]|nr:hypothetical protein [Actinotalea sp.]